MLSHLHSARLPGKQSSLLVVLAAVSLSVVEGSASAQEYGSETREETAPTESPGDTEVPVVSYPSEKS